MAARAAPEERLVRLLSAATFFIFFRAYMGAPLIPRLAGAFQTTEQTLGLIVPAYLIPYGGSDALLRSAEATAKGKLVRAEGLEPSRALRPNGFSYPSTAFAAPASSAGFGVWTIPSPCPDLAPSLRCCPSSLYTFPTGTLIAPAGLGSGTPRYGVPRI